jgi:hypothetical protein
MGDLIPMATAPLDPNTRKAPFLAVKVTPDLLVALDERARVEGTSRSAETRRALREHLGLSEVAAAS